MTNDFYGNLKQSIQIWYDIFRLTQDLSTDSKLVSKIIYQKKRFSDLQHSEIMPLLDEAISRLVEIRNYIDEHRVSRPSDIVTAQQTYKPYDQEIFSQATEQRSDSQESDVPNRSPQSMSDVWFSQLEPEE